MHIEPICSDELVVFIDIPVASADFGAATLTPADPPVTVDGSSRRRPSLPLPQHLR